MPNKRPEVYKTEDEIKEEARLRREQEEQISAEGKPKSERQKKLDNYWYHYKWHTFAGIAALLLVILFFKDTVFRTKADATIIMISERYYSSDELEELQEKLEQVAWDRNGDGKVYIQIDFISMPGEDSGETAAAQEDYASQMKLVAVVAAGSDPLYLLDEAAYNRLVNMGADDEDEPAADNVFVPVSANADQFGLSGMRLYLRSATGSGQEYYDYCGELLQSLNE